MWRLPVCQLILTQSKLVVAASMRTVSTHPHQIWVGRILQSKKKSFIPRSPSKRQSWGLGKEDKHKRRRMQYLCCQATRSWAPFLLPRGLEMGLSQTLKHCLRINFCRRVSVGRRLMMFQTCLLPGFCHAREEQGKSYNIVGLIPRPVLTWE